MLFTMAGFIWCVAYLLTRRVKMVKMVNISFDFACIANFLVHVHHMYTMINYSTYNGVCIAVGR